MRSLVRKRLRTIRGFAVWGLLIGAIVGTLVGRLDGLSLPAPSVRGAIIGILIGTGIGVGEELILPRWSRRMSFGRLNFARTAGYMVLMIVALVTVNAADGILRGGMTPIASITDYAAGAAIARDLVFALVTAVVVSSYLQIRKLHNPGEIRRLLTGRYHYPREERRIFLFADLVGSTAIAERLGHIAYSSFLRDCFSDVSEAILAWQGQVYQHAGDSVIVSWEFEEAARSAAPIRCFGDMVELLEARAADYVATYQAAPELRAGIHGGEVVTTWVGEARKDLAYHGDTLNTTARLEGLCKEMGAECLVSDQVYAATRLPSGFASKAVGAVSVRGRSASLKLWAVERAPDTSPTT